jgi:hypothetical protein
VYPWSTAPIYVVEAYLDVALQRDELDGQPTNAPAACSETMNIIKHELNVRYETSSSADDEVSKRRGDELTDCFGKLQTDNVRAPLNFGPVLCNNQVPDEQLSEVMDSMQHG